MEILKQARVHYNLVDNDNEVIKAGNHFLRKRSADAYLFEMKTKSFEISEDDREEDDEDDDDGDNDDDIDAVIKAGNHFMRKRSADAYLFEMKTKSFEISEDDREKDDEDEDEDEDEDGNDGDNDDDIDDDNDDDEDNEDVDNDIKLKSKSFENSENDNESDVMSQKETDYIDDNWLDEVRSSTNAKLDWD
jgi:hypothetical protein